MPVFTSKNLQLHYQHLASIEPTQNVPLLMLAGMASDSASWQPVVRSLNQNFELILPDNRCCGQTLPNPIETNRSLMIGDILTLLDELNIERVNILGHSMGGMLGWALAAHAPERINNLVAAAALPYVIPARIALFESLSAVRTESTEAEWFRLLYQFLFCSKFFNDKSSVDFAVNASMHYPFKQSAESFAAQVAGLNSFIEPPNMNTISCSVTMITGSNDVLTTPDMIKDYAAGKSFIKTHVIEDAAHALHWEQSEQFATCVKAALM